MPATCWSFAFKHRLQPLLQKATTLRLLGYAIYECDLLVFRFRAPVATATPESKRTRAAELPEVLISGTVGWPPPCPRPQSP